VSISTKLNNYKKNNLFFFLKRAQLQTILANLNNNHKHKEQKIQNNFQKKIKNKNQLKKEIQVSKEFQKIIKLLKKKLIFKKQLILL